MNSIERLLKEWSTMLDYVCGNHTGSIKSLCKANNLNYMRFIKIHKLLRKKEDKVGYVKAKIQHIRKQLLVIEESLPSLEPLEPLEPLPSLESYNNIYTFTQPIDCISIHEFQETKTNFQVQINELVENEKNNILLTTCMIIINSLLCGIIYVISLPYQRA
jgi:hypothetical protein